MIRGGLAGRHFSCSCQCPLVVALTICGGLAGRFFRSSFQRFRVGIPSAGMVLCSSDEAHTAVDPITPPEGAAIGERVTFEGHEGGLYNAHSCCLQHQGGLCVAGGEGPTVDEHTVFEGISGGS